METDKIYVLVEKDKALINKLCRVAFKNYFEIQGWHRPNNINKASDEEIAEIIKKYANYNSRFLVFSVKPSGFLEINFFRLYQNGESDAEFYDGLNPDDLKKIISWIKSKKPECHKKNKNKK